MESDQIPLHAMSAPQRRIVERNLALVRLTLRRYPRLGEQSPTGREHGELFQEGCLALMEAVRNHDPTRHGSFAAFAMARIHFAVSRYAHERLSLIRVPFITQRRRQEQKRQSQIDRHHPDPLPHVLNLAAGPQRFGSTLRAQRHRDPTSSPPTGPTIGDLLRERLDQAAKSVVKEMKTAPRCGAGHAELVERCAKERWTIPEPTARTPIRQMARSLHCSVGRITHCEERFHKKVAQTLIADDVFKELTRLARRQPTGMKHCPSSEELTLLQPAADDRV